MPIWRPNIMSVSTTSALIIMAWAGVNFTSTSRDLLLEDGSLAATLRGVEPSVVEMLV
jgi:hypothetical protein